MFGGKTKQLEALSKQLDAVNAENAKLRLQIDQAIAAIEESGDVEQRINRRVNSVLAAIGVTQFAAEKFAVTKDKSGAAMVAHWQSLTGQEQTEYYKIHKAEIMVAMTA